MRIAPFFLVLLAAAPAMAGLPANTTVALWVTGLDASADVPDGRPPRFVLLEDGRVFVGGSSILASAKIEGRDVKGIESQASKVRKMSGLGGNVSLGPGPQRYRVVLRKGPEIVVSGDPARAPAALKPLAGLIQTLLDFDHPALRPWVPESFLLHAQPGAAFPGCRDWRLPGRPAEARQGVVIPAAAAAGWPTGGTPAWVCDGDSHYTVTLRPLIPGETP